MAAVLPQQYLHLAVEVEGSDLPLNMPISHYSRKELPRIPEEVLKNLQASCASPSQLQCYAVPVALTGRDVALVGAAGDEELTNTLVLPLISILLKRLRHDLNVVPAATFSGHLNPVAATAHAIVLVPTRELAVRAATEVETVAQHTPVRCAVACGGLTSTDSVADALKNGLEVLVCTPRRLHELLERGSLSLGGVQQLLIVAIDSIIDLGFKEELRRLLLHNVLPGPQVRQTVFTCAAFSHALRHFSTSSGFIRADAVNITAAEPWRAICKRPQCLQQVAYAEEISKTVVLSSLLVGSKDLVIVVCNTRKNCEMVHYCLQAEGMQVGLLHGERVKVRDREATLRQFASGNVPVLVTPDSMLTQLELPYTAHIIGFDFPDSMDAYAQRMRLVGTHGHTGCITTLVTEAVPFALLEAFVQVLRESENKVPRWLDGLLKFRTSQVPSVAC